MKLTSTNIRVKYSIILFLQFALWFILMIFHNNHLFQSITISVVLFFFAVVIMLLKPKRFLKYLAIITGLLGLIGSYLWLFPHITGFENHIAVSIARFSFSIFILTAIFTIGYNVFVADRITADQIIGGISIYILIATFFACIYSGISSLIQGALVLPYDGGRPLEYLAQYMYYSVMILTTTGLGDIIPQHPAARYVTSIEGIVGPVYLAIMMARLVGMHISQSSKKLN